MYILPRLDQDNAYAETADDNDLCAWGPCMLGNSMQIEDHRSQGLQQKGWGASEPDGHHCTW